MRISKKAMLRVRLALRLGQRRQTFGDCLTRRESAKSEEEKKKGLGDERHDKTLSSTDKHFLGCWGWL